MRSLFFLLLLLCLNVACSSAQSVDPISSQADLQAAWQQDWHGSWELNWPQAPVPGPLVAEVWSAEAGTQRRYEILEAPVASMVGLAYAKDGTMAGYYNRLEDTAPVTGTSQTLHFPPISNAFGMIDTLTSQTPQAVLLKNPLVAEAPVDKYQLSYSENKTLTVWLDRSNHLIIRLELTSPTSDITLAARSLELLTDPHPRLFTINTEK